MADFTSLICQVSTGDIVSLVWTTVGGSGHEVRFANSNTVPTNTASASWPAISKPVSGVRQAPYAYAFTADTSGALVLGFADIPAVGGYFPMRWTWDNTGTFASAPIFTAYPSSSHGSITRGDGSLLGGHTSDTGATARSYLKGNAWGRVASAGTGFSAVVVNTPGATDGTTGSMSPAAGAFYMTNWQSLQGDNDYITAPFTPAAVTADSWDVLFRLFTGANMDVGTATGVFSLKYAYT